MEDTDTLYVSMKEKFYISTQTFQPGLYRSPGEVLRITADPIGCMLQKVITQDGEKETIHHYASPLAVTASRFRDFMYVGSTFALVPAATTAQVDPAHVSDTGAGSSNYLDPIDMSACIHYRRWLGGDFLVPSVDPTGVDVEKPSDPKFYTQEDAQRLDVAWLNDSRFNHVPVTDGFSFDSVPMEAGVVTAAHATDSVFGFYSYQNMSFQSIRTGESLMQPLGLNTLRGSEIKRRLWGPNPFAGFVYKCLEDYHAENPNFDAYEINRRFPWFADMVDISITGVPHLVDIVYDMVQASYLNPLCILRLPPAYGSRFFWSGYMRHYFAFRHPYLLDGTWTAGKVEQMIYDSSDLSQRVPNADGSVRIVPRAEQPKGFIGVFHAEPTDPFAFDNEIQKITLQDEDAGLIAQFRDKIRDASISDVLDYLHGYDKGKAENVADQPPADLSPPVV